MQRSLAIVASVLLLMTLVDTRLAGADGAWLDGPVTNWNQPGMAIPQAPPRNVASQPMCFDALVVPDSPGKQAVSNAGWFLYNTPAGSPPIEIVNGQSNADGMCRPTGYQAFVFVDGTFAGTLSPILMNSRDDGALVEASVQPGDEIQASYVRYTPQDPLCCPSARSTATFKIDRSGASPVAVLQSVSTVPTSATPSTPPPSTPPPAPTAAPSPTLAPPPAPVQVPRGK